MPPARTPDPAAAELTVELEREWAEQSARYNTSFKALRPVADGHPEPALGGVWYDDRGNEDPQALICFDPQAPRDVLREAIAREFEAIAWMMSPIGIAHHKRALRQMGRGRR